LLVVSVKISKPLLITKLKATAVHLSMSIVVFIYLAYQIYYNWYPEPYFTIDGGWQGIRLVGAVDLVLGPFITFLIFNLNKSRRAILFDLLVIAVVQLSVLSYGIHLTYSQRPVAVVLMDQFVVSATMDQYGGKLQSADDLQRYSDEKPPIIFSDFPLDREGIDEVQRIKLEDKVIELAQMHLYRPRSELPGALQQRQPAERALLEQNGKQPALAEWLQQNGKAEDEVLILHFEGRYGYAWLVFDSTGRLLGYFL
jgi:hypothetical protein